MAGKEKKKELSFVEAMGRLRKAGLAHSPAPDRYPHNSDMPSFEARMKDVLGIVNQQNRPIGNMLFFVMYDIESDKVRRLVVKYLQRKGCTRVQKSIFLADLATAKYEQIKHDLAEVQACYENNDIILVVPISTDYLKAMKVIGQTINVDVITKTSNTLFF
jgi:CRISPR-associated protein Cas2